VGQRGHLSGGAFAFGAIGVVLIVLAPART
jgi:hypothetical protein